mgnify:CR=1 FL=1
MIFDVALLGAAAILEDGLYYEEEEDAQVKRLAAQRAKKSNRNGRLFENFRELVNLKR